MPRRAKTPCGFPGCPELTESGYCPRHASLVRKQYDATARHPERYDAAWHKIRTAYIHAHPLCERCLQSGRYVTAQEVHHILPLRDGGTNATENLQSLCRKCHAEIHAQLGSRSHAHVVYERNDAHSSNCTK